MREKEKENKRREERSVSARAGKHASQPGKQVNEWTNELTVGGAATFFRRTYFPRRCHHRSRLDSSALIEFHKKPVKRKNNENRRPVLGTCRPRASMRRLPPKSTYVLPYLLSCYWFCSTIPEYLWTPPPPMIS